MLLVHVGVVSFVNLNLTFAPHSYFGSSIFLRNIIIKHVHYLIDFLIANGHFGRSIFIRNILIKPVHYLIGYFICYFGRSISFRNIIFKLVHYLIKELNRSRMYFYPFIGA